MLEQVGLELALEEAINCNQHFGSFKP